MVGISLLGYWLIELPEVYCGTARKKIAEYRINIRRSPPEVPAGRSSFGRFRFPACREGTQIP
jgi:hypothetical protein